MSIVDQSRPTAERRANPSRRSSLRTPETEPPVRDHLIENTLLAIPQNLLARVDLAAQQTDDTAENFAIEALEEKLERVESEARGPSLKPERHIPFSDRRSPHAEDFEQLLRAGRIIYVQGYPPPV